MSRAIPLEGVTHAGREFAKARVRRRSRGAVVQAPMRPVVECSYLGPSASGSKLHWFRVTLDCGHVCPVELAGVHPLGEGDRVGCPVCFCGG